MKKKKNFHDQKIEQDPEHDPKHDHVHVKRKEGRKETTMAIYHMPLWMRRLWKTLWKRFQSGRTRNFLRF